MSDNNSSDNTIDLTEEAVARSTAPPLASQGYPFLNHDSETLPNKQPPVIDNKALTRQKRKRTSPEDQAVLEAAYKRDPKPDRAARLEIVDQVALGEKEVQIWFQNRRQSSRRKARPLLPHEIAQYQFGRSSFGSGDDSELRSSLDASGVEVLRQTDADGLSEREKKATLEKTTSELQAPHAAPSADMVGDRARAVLREAEERVAYEPPTSSFPAPSNSHEMGYLSNRRSGSFFRSSQNEPLPAVESTIPPTTTPPSAAPPRSLRRVASVHLAMDSEGKAVVSTKDSTDPSPPRAAQLPPSAFGLSTGSNQSGTSSLNFRQSLDSTTSANAQKKLRRSASGRSRDSRTWEFWCDKDARLEAEKAEKEAVSSQPTQNDAAEAIGLMRSNSGRRSILGASQSSNHKRLSQHQHSGTGTSAKRRRLSTDNRTPLLQRASTWQPSATGPNTADADKRKPKPKLKYTGSQVSVYIPGNDSDKENWSPERPRQLYHGHAHPPPAPPALGTAASQKRNRNPGVSANADAGNVTTAVSTSGTPRVSGLRSTLAPGTSPLASAKRKLGVSVSGGGRGRGFTSADHAGLDDEELEDEDDEDDEEVAAFMRGSGEGAAAAAAAGDRRGDGHGSSEVGAIKGAGASRGVKRASHSSSQEEDLDCVQGLLSLREGLWR
ncbi:hypothetical protein MBLNU230_g7279t1 [Neophaeotheca triangularis]